MERINKDIKEGTLKHFYLLTGDEGYLKKQYREKLVHALVDPEDSMNYYYEEGNNPNLSNIYDLAETLPFFAERRAIVLENTGLLKKSIEDIKKRFEAFPDTTYFVMVEDEVDGRNALYKFFKEKGYVAEMKMPSDKQLLSWVKKICNGAEKTIDDTAVFYLIEHMGSEMYLLKNELDKLISYCADKTNITIEDINAICLDEAEDKIFDMLDAIASKNQKKALKLYRDLLELRKPAMQILALLNRHYNILMQICSLKEEGKDYKTMASVCGIQPFTVKKYVNQTSAYDFSTLYKMVERCQRTEQEVKTGVVKDVVGVELLIVEFSGSGSF